MRALQRFYSLIPASVRRGLTPRVKRALSNLNVTRVRDDLFMDLSVDEYVENLLRRGDQFEPLTTRLFGDLLRSGDAYMDVGAHVGYHTLIARKCVGPSGTIIAIDPQPHNCAKILRNWQLNNFGNLVVYPAAASDQQRFLILHDQPPTDRARLSIMEPSLAGDMPQRFVVPAIRLDTLLEDHGLSQVRLLKIDAEGHEPQVLSGLGERLKDIDNIIVEVCEPHLPHYVKMADRLRQEGFILRTVDRQPWNGNTAPPEQNVWASREPSSQ